MWIIVKRVIVTEGSNLVNMMAVQIEHGCHNDLESATMVYDDLNDREDTTDYDCVYLLNHS